MKTAHVIAAAIAAVATSSAAQVRDGGPAMADAAARAALPRAEIRTLRPDVRTIQGLSGNIADSARGISGDVVALAAVQRSLSANGLSARLVNGALEVSLPGDVLFDFDKSTVRARALSTLERVKNAATATGTRPVIVQGHTDAVGTRAYNQSLSEARAAAVADWLATAGIPRGRLQSRGYGSDRPVAPNTSRSGKDDPAGRQRNRPVTITL